MSKEKVINTEPKITSVSTLLKAVSPSNGMIAALPVCHAGNKNVHVDLDRIVSSDGMELLLRITDKQTSTNGIFSIQLNDLLLALAADFTRQVQELDKKVDAPLDDQAQAELAKKQFQETLKGDKKQDLKSLYNINCPYCDHDQLVAPSPFHQRGAYDLGKGCCKNCDKWMDVIYQPDTDSMKARKIPSDQQPE